MASISNNFDNIPIKRIKDNIKPKPLIITGLDGTNNNTSNSTTLTGPATSDFTDHDKLPNVKITIEHKKMQEKVEKLRSSLSYSEVKAKAKEEAAKNGHSYEANYIAAAYDGFHTSAIYPSGIDPDTAQAVKAGIVDAVKNYDDAKCQLDSAKHAASRMAELKDLIKQYENKNIKPEEYESWVKELAQHEKVYPDVNKSIKEAEENLKLAEQKLKEAQKNYKDVYLQNANMDVIRFLLKNEYIPYEIQPRITKTK